MTQSPPKLEPDQWAAVLDAVEAVIDVPASERHARLTELLADDSVLVQTAHGMLALECGDSAPDERAFDSPVDALSSATAPFTAMGGTPRDEVGPYRLHGEIGRGGMGQVFLASRSDGAIDRRVALKLVHPGLGTKEVIARFERERQVQASLLHPGIAVLLDGGATTDGLPYLVMEYVDGLRLDQWCDEHRLNVDERLALFVKAADAVAFAHGSRVIHRDLKPSNILVTAEGQPKLLDFGIAKVLDGDRNVTETLTVEGMQRMTPAYASPEQLRGEEVTVATDVYSLGTLLFEVLTGHTPHMLDGCSVAEIERSVCEEPPRRPSRAVLEEREVRSDVSDGTTRTVGAEELGLRRQSTPSSLRRQIQGDLERIVMKCLRKEPDRRYASVNGLIADLERYRDGRTILARPESLLYRARTFVRRHWIGVTAAAGVIATLTGVLIFSLMQYGRAVDAGVVAEEKGRLAEERLQSLMEFRWDVLSKVAPAINELPGALDARERLIQAVMANLERETAILNGDAPRTEELIHSYLTLADLQGHPRATNRGYIREAKGALLESEVLSADLMSAFPRKSRAAWLRAKVDLALGSLLSSSGDYVGAESYLSEAIELSVGAVKDKDFGRRDQLYGLWHESHKELSYLALSQGDLGLARENAEAAADSLEERIVEFPQQVYFLDGDRLNVQALLGEIAIHEGHFDDALDTVSTARERLLGMMQRHGSNALFEEMNATMLNVIAGAYEGLGRREDAVHSMKLAVDISASHRDASEGDIRALESLAGHQIGLARLYLRSDSFALARDLLESALEASEHSARQRQDHYDDVLRTIDIESGLARCAVGEGDHVEADRLATSAKERLSRLRGEHAERYGITRREARLEWTLGLSLAAAARGLAEPKALHSFAEAVEHLDAALGLNQSLVDQGLGGVGPARDVVEIQALLAGLRSR